MDNQDFLVNEDGEPIIQNGDFVIGESNIQHIQDILLAAPGHYNTAPTLGPNLMAFNDSEMDDALKNEMIRIIALSLSIDKYKLLDYNFSTGEIKVGQKGEI